MCLSQKTKMKYIVLDAVSLHLVHALFGRGDKDNDIQENYFIILANC